MDDEASTRRATTFQAPVSGRVSSLASLPKLQRQLSQVMTRAFGPDDQPLGPTAQVSPEDERYERMMDHFHLRHDPQDNSASKHVVATDADGARSARNPVSLSRNHSIHADPKRLSANQPSARVYVATDNAGNDDSEFPRVPPAYDVGIWRFITRDWERLPFSPTGLSTRLRLFLLSLVFALQVVYMPYGIAYYPPHFHKTVALDTAIDVAYFLNILAVCNTQVYTGHGPPITSRRAIWRQYRSRGLLMDALAAMPVEILFHFVHKELWVAWIVRVGHLVIQYLSFERHLNRLHRSWKHEVMRTDKSVIAWILYSRYSHLVRIGVIVCLVMVMAHYFACVWSLLRADVDPTFLLSRDPLEIHIRSIYDALQFLQGQGQTTTTPAQDLFGSVAVLLGSIALAVIFGHVAILVSNFSANQTSYQRTMERVFAIMGKFQLPHPIRERVHQYYEYLHAEYESLDGEIATFTMELSHTLELEVVLFKYMDVVMHVPLWRECSPDFQKQLVLNLSVRVYLPDDFIMRRGEVGTECYIINRGTCKQHEYATGNYEPPKPPMVSDKSERSRHSLGQESFPQIPTAPTINKVSFVLPESDRSDTAADGEGPYTISTILTRGQMLGDMALIANYERSSDVRAVSYAEMCVFERETFQRILTRYPHDREIVLTSIVGHTMSHLAANQVPRELMEKVREVVPDATVAGGVELVTKAINPRETDPSIVFGVTEELTKRLQIVVPQQIETIAAESTDAAHNASPTAPRQRGACAHCGATGLTVEGELLRMMKEMQGQLTQTNERLARLEERKPSRRQPRNILKKGHVLTQQAAVRLQSFNSASNETTSD